MGLISIHWPTAPQSLGAYSTTMGAAVLSATVLASADVQEVDAKVSRRLDIRWSAAHASPTSFQGTAVSHGTTSATTVAIRSAVDDSDPWEELKTLGPDWDGSGAEPVSRQALDHAMKFVESLGRLGSTFEPFAHPNGSVGLEARKPGKAAYLIVSAADSFAYVLRVGDTVHRGKDVEPSLMRRVLDLLY